MASQSRSERRSGDLSETEAEETEAEETPAEETPAEEPQAEEDLDFIPPPPRRSDLARGGPGLFRKFRDGADDTAAKDLDSSCIEWPATLGLDSISAPPGYKLLEMIGQGGMGVVFRAHQESLNRTVAIKLLSSTLPTSGEERQRFYREAEAAAHLQHPNIVQVHEVTEYRGVPFLIMQYVDGGTLLDRMNRRPLPARESASFVAVLADAIDAAHRQGIIHRDLKPSNILLQAKEPSERQNQSDGPASAEPLLSDLAPRISDFGLARILQDDNDITRTGTVLGTPNYMSPEQANGQTKAIGPAADVYALGAILYELTTGRPPFASPSFLQVLDQVRNEEPLSPNRLTRGLPKDVCTICLKCLEKNPSKRYASAADLADDLRRFVRGETIHARPTTAVERSVKWIRRNPAWAATISVTLSASLVMAALTLRHNRLLKAEVVRANAGEDDARRQQRLAMTMFHRGFDALDDLLQNIGVNSRNSTQASKRATQLYEQVIGYYYEVLEGADESDPEVRLAGGKVLVYAGSLQFLLGRYDKATQDLDAANSRLQSLLKRTPENLAVLRHLARCKAYQARTLNALGDSQKAKDRFAESLELLETIADRDPTFPRLSHNLAQTHHWIGAALIGGAQSEAAYHHFGEASRLYRLLLRDNESDDSLRIRLGMSLAALTIIDLDAARYDKTESLVVELESLWRNATDRSSFFAREGLAETYRLWGLLESSRGNSTQACVRFDEGIHVMEKALAETPLDVKARSCMHGLWRIKAWTLSRSDAPHDIADSAWRQAIEFADGGLRTHALAELAWEYAGRGDSEAAGGVISQAISESPESAATWLHLARASAMSSMAPEIADEPERQQADRDVAQQCWEQAIERGAEVNIQDEPVLAAVLGLSPI